jgi:Domain of unknown function (DUF4126)
VEALLTALGLAAPAGLNAPLVLLMVGLADRLTGFDLGGDYDMLASTPVLIGLGVWLLVEEVLDKIVGADHANDLVQTVFRPAAGGLLALAVTTGTDVPAGLALVLGVISAGGVHAVKATARPAVSVGTLGVGNPFVSIIEDVVAAAAVVVALIAPVLALLALVGVVALLVWLLRRARQKRQ